MLLFLLLLMLLLLFLPRSLLLLLLLILLSFLRVDVSLAANPWSRKNQPRSATAVYTDGKTHTVPQLWCTLINEPTN